MIREVIEVADNPEESRYEIRVDGVLAGFADYRPRPGRIVITHTEIGEEFGGRGLGGTLVREALDSARAAGLTVTPLCGFVAEYIRRHPEYQELVAEPGA
ncbi:GNAT family N-acetyltransferase [Sphaerimonospora thailandensis]|uniref:GNAT family N-acetyltransferase n=1 Tax=Sphaerimonospora thailandensis TaxID=795644 RepID=UPI00194DCE78|nr:GNAT family N-acetyltransferase [Sphaerimonospora thailandensis]